MTDLKDVLDREASRVHASEGTRERVHERATRRRRSRRVLAGVVGIAIAAGGTTVAVRALGPAGEPSRVGSPPAEGTDLWPHPNPGDAELAHARAVAEDPAYVWQSNETEVALRYATDVLAWDSVTILRHAGHRFELLGCDLEPAIGCAAKDRVRLTLTEVLRRGEVGVWGVTEVDVQAGLAPAPSPGVPAPTPSPAPTGTHVDAERTALAFARARVSLQRADLFLQRPAADAYHGGSLSLYADYRGFEVGGSEQLEDGRVRIWIGLVTEVTPDECWETFYEIVVIDRDRVVEAEGADGASFDCLEYHTFAT